MTDFLLATLLLAGSTLVVLAWPVWQHRKTIQGSPMNSEITALRTQLKQLEELHAAGTLGDAAYAEARAGLERKVIAAVMQGSPSPTAGAPARHMGLGWLLGLAVLLVVVVGGGYAWLGRPDAVAVAPNTAPAAVGDPQAPHALSKEQMGSMVETLSARLDNNPDDAQGWGMLARTYAVTGEHAKAVPAFRKAMALRKDDPVLLADFADALAMSNDRVLAGEPTQLIDQALALDPDNLKALSLAGTAAFDRKDYAGAVTHWERLQRLAPADNVLVRQIQGGITEARQLAGLPAALPLAAAASSKPGAQVAGVVTLAPALVAKASPGDTLFVFARATDGSRMPLAILRKQVKDLPLSFTLDDSLAMSPSASLSLHDKVIVDARISRSGQATPQAGDLQGQSAAVALGRKDLKIEISEVVGQ